MSENITECGIYFLSYERACKLVPPEYLVAYEWYQDHENETFSCLPMGDHAPKLSASITLARQSGIHTPSYPNLKSKGAGKPRYALLIHSEGSASNPNAPYPDTNIIHREDGTWTFDYCAHKSKPGKETNQNYNGDLMNNLIDGVPVAVFVKYPGIGYINHGLAYVERFDALTQIFTLHGPVSAEANNIDFCSILPYEQLTEKEKQLFREADDGDLRKRVLAEQVRREKQGEFRKMVLDAYSGKCAITQTDVPAALQAAHIDPYRGKQSQTVTNGILLRSDIHLLYDAHLLTILPEKRIVRIGKQLKSSAYKYLNDLKVDVPEDPSLQPDDSLLEMHAKEFSLVEKKVGAA